MSTEPIPSRMAPQVKRKGALHLVFGGAGLFLLGGAAALWLFIGSLAKLWNPYQIIKQLGQIVQAFPPPNGQPPPKRLLIPPSTPVVVRGGSVKAYCRGCNWSSVSKGRTTNISGTAPSVIYLEDVDTTSGDATVSVPMDWKITLTFRKSDGIQQSGGAEILSICTQGATGTCSLSGNGSRSTIYLLSDFDGFMHDDQIENPRVRYNMKSDCGASHATPESPCNHIHTIKIQWNTPGGAQSRTFHCIDGECGIGIGR